WYATHTSHQTADLLQNESLIHSNSLRSSSLPTNLQAEFILYCSCPIMTLDDASTTADGPLTPPSKLKLFLTSPGSRTGSPQSGLSDAAAQIQKQHNADMNLRWWTVKRPNVPPPPPLTRSFSLPPAAPAPPSPPLSASGPATATDEEDDSKIPEMPDLADGISPSQSSLSRRRGGVCITVPNTKVRLAMDDIRIFYDATVVEDQPTVQEAKAE
ncbi:hypothetical protein BJ742DRAFT_903305, partial [Cladochytrium replicatum]